MPSHPTSDGPIPAEPGKRDRYDYEYVRNGTANVFMFVDVNRPWRHAKITDQRTGADFAECMRDLVDEHYPEADRIRVVLDNLSTHSQAALYEWEHRRNREGARIEWLFTVDRAREKLGRAYPAPSSAARRRRFKAAA